MDNINIDIDKIIKIKNIASQYTSLKTENSLIQLKNLVLCDKYLLKFVKINDLNFYKDLIESDNTMIEFMSENLFAEQLMEYAILLGYSINYININCKKMLQHSKIDLLVEHINCVYTIDDFSLIVKTISKYISNNLESIHLELDEYDIIIKILYDITTFQHKFIDMNVANARLLFQNIFSIKNIPLNTTFHNNVYKIFKEVFGNNFIHDFMLIPIDFVDDECIMNMLKSNYTKYMVYIQQHKLLR
jgi:hypothetical protein